MNATEAKRPPPMVHVEWEDAACLDSTHWVNPEVSPLNYVPVLINTVGYLLMDSPEVIVVTGSWSENQIGPRDQIPRGMVRKLSYLGPVLAPATKKTKNR